MLKEVFEQNNEKICSNQAELAVPFKLSGTDQEKAMMTDLVNRVAESEFGKEILSDAAALGYTLRMDDLGRATKGVCRSTALELVLSTRMPEDMLVITLAHEARHAGQIGRGAIAGYIPACSLSSLMPHKRLMEADAVASSILVANELLEKGDYMPVTMVHRDYEGMAQAFEKTIEDGKSKPEALTQCALGWYDNVPRKMAYEEDHIITPLKEGYYSLNTSGGYVDLDKNAGMEAICTYNGKNYFSESPQVLDTKERAGMSSYTAEWVKNHIDVCKKMFNTDVSDVVKGIDVYEVSDSVIKSKEEKYGRFPVAISSKGTERLQNAVQVGRLKPMKNNSVAIVLNNQKVASR